MRLLFILLVLGGCGERAGTPLEPPPTVFDAATWTGTNGQVSLQLHTDRYQVTGSVTYGDTTIHVSGTESRAIPAISFALGSLKYSGTFTSSYYNEIKGALTGRITESVSGRWNITLRR